MWQQLLTSAISQRISKTSLRSFAYDKLNYFVQIGQIWKKLEKGIPMPSPIQPILLEKGQDL